MSRKVGAKKLVLFGGQSHWLELRGESDFRRTDSREPGGGRPQPHPARQKVRLQNGQQRTFGPCESLSPIKPGNCYLTASICHHQNLIAEADGTRQSVEVIGPFPIPLRAN